MPSNLEPTPGDVITGFRDGWPKILTQFGLIGLVCGMLITLTYWQRADSQSALTTYGRAIDTFSTDRDLSRKEAHEAHMSMVKLTAALESNTRATYRLLDEIRAVKGVPDKGKE
jgi:hypothetical protein